MEVEVEVESILKGFFDFIKYRMEEYGRPIGVKYAEAFTVERTFGVDNLTNLI